MSNEITAPITISPVSITAPVTLGFVGPEGPAGAAGPSSVTASTSSDGTAALYLDSIRFETSNGGPTQQGQMAWESTDGSIDAMLESGVIVAVGEDLMIRVRNRTGSEIAKGTALAYDGTTGASGRIFVKPWVGANIPAAKLFVGFAAAAIDHNGNGYSQWIGKLDGIDTSGGAQNWQDEEIVYAVPGSSATLTNVAPTSGEYAAAAVVVNAGSGTSGILFVRPTFEAASATLATANTLVLRDGNGGFSAGAISASTVSSSGFTTNGQVEFNGGDAGDSLTFNMVNYFYGEGAASAHRIALGAGTTGEEIFQAATAAAALTTLGGGTPPTGSGAIVRASSPEFAGDVVFPGANTGDVAGNRILWGASGSWKAYTQSGYLNFLSGNNGFAFRSSLLLSSKLITYPGSRVGPGALPTSVASVALTTTGVGDAITLANGVNGQILTICHVSRGGGTGTAVLTPDTANGFSTITFTNSGDSVALQYFTTGGWCVTGSRGVTIA